MKKVWGLLLTIVLIISFTIPVSANSFDESNYAEVKVVKELPKSEMIVPKIIKVSDDTDYLKKVKNKSPFMPLGAGEWDYIGSSTFKSRSVTFYSGGGDLKIYIVIPTSGGAQWLFKLYEEDPAWHWTVSQFEMPNKRGTYYVEFDVRGLPDGNNGKAELHLAKLTYPFNSVYTEWYD